MHHLMLGQVFRQERALQRVGDVVFARVDLRAVDGHGDPHRELGEELVMEIVELCDAEVARDAKRAQRALARHERKGKDFFLRTDRAGGEDDRVRPELIQLDREAAGERGHGKLRDALKGKRVVERRGEHFAGRRQEAQAQGQTLRFGNSHNGLMGHSPHGRVRLTLACEAVNISRGYRAQNWRFNAPLAWGTSDARNRLTLASHGCLASDLAFIFRGVANECHGSRHKNAIERQGRP